MQDAPCFEEVSMCPNNKVKERFSPIKILQPFWCDLELQGTGPPGLPIHIFTFLMELRS